MKKLKEIIEYPAMWRTSHGFGVHSPFAYNFITKVIGEHEAAYYAYSEIAAFCPKSKKASFNEIFAGRDMSISEGRLIFRILCYFNPKEVFEIGHGHEVTNVILRNAVPAAKVTFLHHKENAIPTEEGEPVIVANLCSHEHRELTAGFIKNIIAARDAVVVIRNMRTVPAFTGLLEEVIESVPHGMVFTDGWTAVFVARHSLPRMVYKVFM